MSGGLRPPILKFSFQVGDVWFCGFYPALPLNGWPRGVMSGHHCEYRQSLMICAIVGKRYRWTSIIACCVRAICGRCSLSWPAPTEPSAPSGLYVSDVNGMNWCGDEAASMWLYLALQTGVNATRRWRPGVASALVFLRSTWYICWLTDRQHSRLQTLCWEVKTDRRWVDQWRQTWCYSCCCILRKRLFFGCCFCQHN